MRHTFYLCLFLATQTLWGQTKISVTLNNSTFVEFVKVIEERTPYRFYFNPIWTDSLSVTLSATDVELKTLLVDVFKTTDLDFVITPTDKVYLTKGKTLITELPKGMFQTEGSPLQDDPVTSSAFDSKVKKLMSEEVKLHIIGKKAEGLTGSATIYGYVRMKTTGEAIPGVAVFLPDPFIGTSTDALGYYSITIPKGKKVITIQSVGMKSAQRTVLLYGNGSLDVELDEEITSLKDVIVNADNDIAVRGLQMGKEKLDIRIMKQMPLALGETDVLKVILALPGVQNVGEGASGLNVRGGAANQNLILFNDATIYNPSHLFGFFSTFNPDVLKGIELYKSGFEANVGGRLSSVLEVTSREGNLKKFTATGGISPITGRLTLEGPINKGNTSFLVAGRSTYSDWILNKLDDKQFQSSSASFYDVNFNLGHKINNNNHLTFSAYASRDQFKLSQDTLYAYSDKNASVKWSHRFSQNFSGTLIATVSDYEFSMSSQSIPKNAFTLNYSIRQFQTKADFNYILNKHHTFNTGISSIFYRLKPGAYTPLGAESLVAPDILERERGTENAIYFGDNIEVNSKLLVYLGLRYSLYANVGPKRVFQYDPQLPIEVSNIMDTVHFSGGPIKTYHGAEPRFNARYLIGKNSSVKFSYSRMRQYIQMLSNNTAISPTDTWKLSDQYVKPQIADQFSIGWFQDLPTVELSVETYYKHSRNVTDYQNGAIFIRNHHIETDILSAIGKSYGAEFMIKKELGRLNGWVSYTWSRSILKTKSPFQIETVNQGNYYPTNFDKPHAVNLITNYKFSRRINISLNSTYSTGRPITLPLAKFELDGTGRLIYSDRNAYRLPDYFRTDLSINIEGNHKIKKLAHSSWTFAIYNLTGRKNAYSIFFRSENGKVNGYKLSIFGQAIPTLTYNFRI
jgi:hypothetical protein